MLFVVAEKYDFRSPAAVAKVFTALSFVELLTSRLTTLLSTLPTLIASTACFTRIQDFLNLDDQTDTRLIGPSSYSLSEIVCLAFDSCKERLELNDNAAYEPLPSQIAVHFDNYSTAFTGSTAPKVRGVNLKLSAGGCLAIVGPVGSGKTSMLKAVLGQMETRQGSIRVASDHMAFCQQSPWLRNVSIRENIVGFDDTGFKWYQTVLRACALQEDLDSFLDGDRHIVGTKGSSLSGGQKQRVVSPPH